MSSAENQIKRSSKFSYLIQKDNQEKLSKYDNLNFSPKIYKRNYDQTHQQISLDKNKQNFNQNLDRSQQTHSKKQAYNKHEQSSSQKHGLISFGKNRCIQRSSKINQNQQCNQKYQSHINSKINHEKIENMDRLRNKSFGNIGLKKDIFEKGKQKINHLVQFSPYREEITASNEDARFGRSNLQFKTYGPNPRKHEQNLLIYQLQEQQLIVRKQLEEYEYQNELLRQKIQYLEAQNYSLKQLSEQHFFQLQEKQQSYQNKMQSLSLNVKELEEQLEICKLENKQLLSQITNDKHLIAQLNQQIDMLSFNNQELEILLNSKDDLIIQLKTKIQLMQVNQLHPFETNVNKRRKSLDLSTQARRVFNQQKALNCDNLKESGDFNENARQYQTQNFKSSHVGKLMNKNFNQTTKIRDQQNLKFNDFSSKNQLKQNTFDTQKLSGIEKYMNFIESIKSMYFKVTWKQARDLKDLWKWLKLIAHEHQSFGLFYGMKDSIMAVLDDLQSRKDTTQIEKELSFMDKECYKIIKKLAEIVDKEV